MLIVICLLKKSVKVDKNKKFGNGYKALQRAPIKPDQKSCKYTATLIKIFILNLHRTIHFKKNWAVKCHPNLFKQETKKGL